MELLASCRFKNMCLEGLEDGFQWRPGQSNGGALRAWKDARLNGVSKVGGRISAARREDESRKACAFTAERWPLPN
ncbi:MAG TPA: hypothetical protein VE178_20475, partial [Silvibacterium sp.]|nr:hypothetical protein [Silvibacterium sp.]